MAGAPTVPMLGGGRFEVRGTLGAGAAGVVYRVLDRQLGREVALKLLRQASGRDLYRFKREFRALADLAHPNLIALHELHAAGGDWYFTMELVEGVGFIDWVRPGQVTGPGRARAEIRAARLEESRLRDALIQLTDALLALHRAGKLHRDLKPSNVLVTRHGRLALLDFGLVAGVAEGDPERLAVGTPVYMSPEQAADQPLGEPSDWYSVGVMLYEALTGVRPFEGSSEQVMVRKQTEVPVHPAELAPTAPLDLAALCLALLEPRPGGRPGGIEILECLGATPSASTRAVARSQPPAVFVGRLPELAELHRALGDARGTGVTVLVRGASGIGKTTLVRRFLRALGDAVWVAQGRCFERETVPFKMLDGVVDAISAAIVALPPAQVELLAPADLGSLARMFPVVLRVPQFAELAPHAAVPADPAELRRRGLRALMGLIARLARLRPLVLFFDDAHWGDPDSAVALAELIHAGTPGVLLLVAHRPDDYLGTVAQLRRPPGGAAPRGDVRELDVAALEPEHAAALVSEVATEPSRASAVVAAGGGNPLVLTELARAPLFEPETRIHDLVRARASGLSPDAYALLAVSSVAGRPLPLEIAAHAAGVLASHDAATQLSIERLATLRQVGEQAILHPAHDYVRAAVLAGLDAESRAGWHAALARAFEAVQGSERIDSQAVVEHWLAADQPAHAAHHAVSAAVAAEGAFAFRRAAELYQVALAHGPWDAAGRRDLLRRKAYALVCAGQLDEAADVYGAAASLLPDAEALDLDRLRVESLLRCGRIEEALPPAERLLAQLGLRIPIATRTSRLRLATQWLHTKLRTFDFVERSPAEVPARELLTVDALYSIASGLAFADPALGRVVQTELLRAALDAGEPVRVCLALAFEVCYASAGGSRNRAAVEGLGARLSALAQRLGHAELIGLAAVGLGVAAHMSGRWAEARAHLERGLAALRDHGAAVRWEIDIGDSFWLATLYYLGEWRDLARLTQILLRDAIDRGDVVAQQRLRTGRCNLAWIVADRPELAREQLAAAERGLGRGFLFQQMLAQMAAVNIDLYVGDVAAASRRLAQAAPEIERLACGRMQLPRVELMALQARAALATLIAAGWGAPGREAPDDRLRPIRGLADELEREAAPWAAAQAHLARGAVYALQADARAADAELAAAEAQAQACGMMGHVHVARLRRGMLEGGALGIARAEAARDALRDLGAVEPLRIAQHVAPWP